MQIYPIDPSFLVDQTFSLGVEPGTTFGIALYRQDGHEEMTPLPACITKGSSGSVSWKGTTPIYPYFQAGGTLGARNYNRDWGWPTITLALPPIAAGTSGVYVAVAFPTDASGQPVNPLGHAVMNRDPMHPYPQEVAASMAMLVGSPSQPTSGAKIAYILPIATYHAYNGSGGGCFYGYNFTNPKIKEDSSVTMRRPGGGLGAFLGEPTDPYDKDSPRQQFAHWDAKFIRWMKGQQAASLLPAVDYYTDLDLHGGNIALSRYRTLVSAGHHEYWSEEMCRKLTNYLQAGGNYACFSGNTCFRPIAFGAYRTPEYMKSIQRLAYHWDNYSESGLIGLSFHYGGGQWGTYSTEKNEWINTKRPPYGLAVQPGMSGHWAFSRTGLKDGDTFGEQAQLVGYEADGVKPGDSSVKILAQSPILNGFQEQGSGGGRGAMVIKNDPGAGPARGAVFNVGTTDWARILADAGTAGNMPVAVVTLRVLRKFAGLSASDE